MIAHAYSIEHHTRYDYGAPVAVSQHVACLRPRDLSHDVPRQRLRWYQLTVDPEPAGIATRVDYFGNTVEQFTLLRPHAALIVRSRSLVEVFSHEYEDDQAAVAWESARDEFVYRKGAPGRTEAEFVFPSPYVVVAAQSREYAAPSFAPGRPLLDAVVDLMHRMHEDFTFDADATTVTTPVTRVLTDRRGVCQDLAHVMISCLRSLGLPARYVSGYVLTDPPPGEARLLGADASHAWVSVQCPGVGWVDVDPTNDVLPGARHVVVGWGRDYGDVCPLRGAFVGAAEHVLEIGVSMIPLDPAQLAQ
ncbi:MAG: transglutaminase N-terminal domain-containing protein [Candidatus Binatia bacterium]